MREPGFWHRRSSWISVALAPLAALYGLVAGWRLQARGFDAGIPVLCVGNYHVGGAGKTPTVLALARLLGELGERRPAAMYHPQRLAFAAFKLAPPTVVLAAVGLVVALVRRAPDVAIHIVPLQAVRRPTALPAGAVRTDASAPAAMPFAG